MSWDLDKEEFYETFTELQDAEGSQRALEWAWSALDWTQKELRKKEEGEKAERAAVVTWLRAKADAMPDLWAVTATAYHLAANTFADGEHRREEENDRNTN
jgi:hypothetical protein